MTALQCCVEGIGLWSPQLANFEALQTVVAGGTPPAPPTRPAANVLPANERRRAPEGVLLAIEVAGQAVAMSGRSAGTLASVFASAQGDQAITDYMCSTLTQTPTELSPTRFHNSVHNAAAGYWTIATECRAPSTAICAQHYSFGAALLEAVSQMLAEQCPMLLVCSDTKGSGPLLEVTGCKQPFGSALVLAPQPSEASLARIVLTLSPVQPATPLPPPLDAWRDSNPSAQALSLLAQLARGHGRCQLHAAATLGLQIEMESLV
jgi:Beta-ketoacyl synthase, N-terminal domain